MDAYEKLSDPDEAFSDTSFDDFGLDDVFGGGLFAFVEIDVLCDNIYQMLGKSAVYMSHLRDGLLRYTMLRKKSIEDRDFLSSCLATKGHRHQLTTMGAIVPTRNMTPISVAVRAGDDGSPPA